MRVEFLWPQCNHKNPWKLNRVMRDPESVTLCKKELTSHPGFEDGKSYEPRNTAISKLEEMFQILFRASTEERALPMMQF